MKNFKIKKIKEKKLIWSKFRLYIDFVILGCCLIIAFNIHVSPQQTIIKDNSGNSTSTKMIYIFHDYEWNEYIMNDNIHWAADSWDYLFEDEVPSDLKWEEKKTSGSVSIWDLIRESEDQYSYNDDNSDSKNNVNPDSMENNNSDSVKDNQVSIDDIMSDLWITGSDATVIDTDINDASLVIDTSDYESGDWIDDSSYYTVKEEVSPDNNSLVIEKHDNDWNNEDYVKEEDIVQNANNSSIARSFTFVEEWRVLPTLVPWNDLFFWNSDQSLSYLDNHVWQYGDWYADDINADWSKKSGITIIEDYADCMTPWWYKIKHWESVLAYQQMDRAPDICNIERRFCWKWKLSGTYTQQWCSVNNNYTYEQWWDTTSSSDSSNTSSSSSSSNWFNSASSSKSDDFKWGTRQNADWTVTVKDSEIWWDFVFDRPNNIYTDFTGNRDNLRPEDEEVEMTTRPHPGCTTPRWEKVKHWQFVQAFKHKNWFSDFPCEAQFRLCTVWELMWTYTEYSCKTWDTSFVDWVYWSPTWQTYSEEKLELIKKQIKSDERKYNKDRKKVWELSNDDDFEELLYLLDENY